MNISSFLIAAYCFNLLPEVSVGVFLLHHLLVEIVLSTLEVNKIPIESRPKLTIRSVGFAASPGHAVLTFQPEVY